MFEILSERMLKAYIAEGNEEPGLRDYVRVHIKISEIICKMWVADMISIDEKDKLMKENYSYFRLFK